MHEVLFPYARQRLADFCRTQDSEPEVAAALAEARALAGQPELDTTGTVALLLAWMAEDRKAGPLKILQGLIWRRGYETGVLKGQVYPDAAQCKALGARARATAETQFSPQASGTRLEAIYRAALAELGHG